MSTQASQQYAQLKYFQMKQHLEQLPPLITQYRAQPYFYATPIIAAYLAYRIYRKVTATNVNPTGKVVVITGCDTGFGHGVAVALDNLGYTVFAGCLTEKGVTELRTKLSSRSTPFQLDVTKQESIEKAHELVKQNSG